MNYKLAKQLKEAGLPQKEHNAHDGSATTYYAPTLSELIEACGDDFGELNVAYTKPSQWFAFESRKQIKKCKECGRLDYEEELRCGVGKSPKIAVAKLYIKLNKKDEEDRTKS